MDDIEDIIEDKGLIQFVIDLSSNAISSEKEYQRIFNGLRKNYKLCPSKSQIRKIYKHLVNDSRIQVNNSILDYTLKKKPRSSSGVSVITILTSPTPEYTDDEGNKVQQTFSCGKNCAYCPDEPEIRISMQIIEINESSKLITIQTNDDISIIRVITYVIKDDIRYDVNQCSKFHENQFTIEMKSELDNHFKIGETMVGVKIAQPRSYLSTEPAVLRGNRNNFDPILQIYDRTDALEICGHEVDKIEILVLGGTWDHYPLNYQTEFIRDIYYSINTLTNRFADKMSLEEEINFSESSKRRIIGLTLETRPDCITIKQIRKLREYNTTRLQIGVQHIDDDVLDKIERGCTTKHTIVGNYLWKQNGGKVDWHLMPDLPGSSIQKDIDMFQKIFGVNSITEVSPNYFRYDLKAPELQADQFKIYPCSVVDWTKIKEWYEDGSYKPYSENEEDLINVIAVIKNNIFPWIRLNRIIRDIPNINILGGNTNVNLRQKLLAKKEINCKCIRCRQYKGDTIDINDVHLFIREYNAVKSTEYFLSFESQDQKILYGFLRLRINHTNDDLIYPELNDCSFIRELHVYGKIVNHQENSSGDSAQHIGLGKKLMKEAECITFNNNIQKIAVIAGVGVREYYQKLGYQLEHNYMIKKIAKDPTNNNVFEYTVLFTIIILIISILYDILY